MKYKSTLSIKSGVLKFAGVDQSGNHYNSGFEAWHLTRRLLGYAKAIVASLVDSSLPPKRNFHVKMLSRRSPCVWTTAIFGAAGTSWSYARVARS